MYEIDILQASFQSQFYFQNTFRKKTPTLFQMLRRAFGILIYCPFCERNFLSGSLWGIV